MVLDPKQIEEIYQLKHRLYPTPLLSHYLAISTETLRLTLSLSLLKGEDAGDDTLITAREDVWDAETFEEQFDLYSTNVPYCHFDLLLLKSCVHEKAMFLSLAQEYTTTEELDFIQNAVHFFLRTPTNYTEALLELLKSTQSSLAKAYLYTVIGLRGDKASLEVLWSHWCGLESEHLPKEEHDLLREGLIIAIGDAYLQVFLGQEFIGSL